MKRQSLRRQTLVTTGCNVAVRGLGFLMRLGFSRLLGPQAMGIMELASGAHMLFLAPASAGLPGAVSRLTAKAQPEDRELILYAGRQLACRIALLLCPLFLLLSPWIAARLGDARTLPSLIFFSPCVLLIGASSVYDGYCFGAGNAWPPALSELAEQGARLAGVLALLWLVPQVTLAYRAALPALSTTLGEAAGLLLMALWIGRVPSYRRDARLPGVKKRLWRLSLPLMATRLSHTGLRMLCGAVIPQRLMAAGLPAGEAVSRLGMLNGMTMPFLMLPGMLAGALGMVGGPAAARCGSARAEGRLAARLLLAALGAGAGCAGLLYLLAPWIGRTVYRLPELTPLLRALCPLSVLMPVQQVLGGLMTGLGLQKKALLASLLGAAATLLCTFCWTYTHGVLGAGYASLAGHALTLFCCAVFFLARPSTHEKQ